MLISDKHFYRVSNQTINFLVLFGFYCTFYLLCCKIKHISGFNSKTKILSQYYYLKMFKNLIKCHTFHLSEGIFTKLKAIMSKMFIFN